MSNTFWQLRPLRLVLGVWTAWVLLVGTSTAQPAPRPVAVLSVASVDALLDDFAYLARVAGRSEVSGFVELATSGFLQEIDRTKPLGVLITVGDDEPEGIGFLAVRDLDKLLQMAHDKLAIEVDSLDNGIRKAEVGQGVYLKQHGGWLYVSDHPRHLARLPEDPVAMCGGLDQQYSVALRVFVQHIPPGLRDLAAFQLHAKIDQDIQAAKLEDPDLDRPFLDSVGRGLKQSVNGFFQQCDQLTLGWAADSDQQRVYLDLWATAVPDAALATALAELPRAPRTLRGAVVPDAAMTIHAGLQLPSQASQAFQAMVAYLRAKALRRLAQDPAAPAVLTEIASTVFDVADRTATDAVIEAAASVVVAPHASRVVAAIRVADGRAVATALQQLYKVARHQPDVPAAEFFAARAGNIDLHRLNIAVGQHDEDARKVFGPALDIVLGTSSDHLYLALGQQSEELLQRTVDPPDASAGAPEDDNQLLAVRLAARPLMAFLAALEPDQEKPRRMAEVVAAARGGDRVALTVEAIPQGLRCRFEVDEGVLEMLAKSATPEQDGTD
ncbi:MAG: hypothetical protein MUF48_15525 [Pirellulaceae bacterium]|nr:hypothetical protein [Pirellulaceae bacterium]